MLLQVACGWKHSLSLAADTGQLFSWGWGGSVGASDALIRGSSSSGGQLGLGDEFDYWQPTHVSMLVDPHLELVGQVNASSWRATCIACGFNHSAAVVAV